MIWKKKQFWGIVVAIALLAYCVKDVTLAELESLYRRISILHLIPAILCSFIFMILKAVRWRLIVLPQKRIPMVRAVTLYSAGQILNILMPALTGQLGRLILFARKESLRKTFVFSTIVLEVLFDAVTLVVFLLLTSLAFVFPAEYRSVSYVIAAITLSLLLLLYLMLHYQYSIEEFGRRRFRERWPGFYVTIMKFIRSFTKGLDLLRSSQYLAGSLTLSIFLWTFHVLVVFFLFKSFSFGLPLATAAAVMIINTLALMIPITPGNAGTFEVAVSTTLTAFAVGKSDAVMFALALHLLDLLPMYSLGVLFLHTERLSLRDIKKEHEDARLSDNVSENGVLVDNQEKV